MDTVVVSELDALRRSLRGTVLLPGEPGYDEARTLWNAMIAYGLATPLGINSTTGVAGLTLAVGFGWPPCTR